MDTIVGPVADKLMAALLPRMQELVSNASKGAEPMIRRVVQEDVLPKFGTATLIGMVAGGVAAAFVGAWFATRRGR